MGNHKTKRFIDMEQANVNEVYNYYRDSLVKMALSQFVYEGVPDTVDTRYMEWILLTHGSVAWLKPTNTDFWLTLNWNTRNAMFDVYGNPLQITGHDYNGRMVDSDEFVILYDNVLRKSMMRGISMWARLLTQSHLTGRNNMMRQNTPYIVTASKTTKLSVVNIFKKILNFEPVITLSHAAGANMAEAIQKVDLDVPFKANEIMDYQKTLWNYALSMLGITGETTKKERLIGQEVAINRQEDTISLESRLSERQRVCDYLNKHYDMNISVSTVEAAVPDPGNIPEPPKQEEDHG